jgi:outer membrane protein assembly factor BamB
VTGAAATVRAPAAAAASWPGYRDNAAHTAYNPDETIIGTGNVAGLSQQWLASTAGSDGGDAQSIAGGRIFTSSYTSPSAEAVQAWNASTGALEWTVSLGRQTSSAAYGDGRVFTNSSNTLYAYNAATGKLDWSVPSGDIYGQDPVYADGLLYSVGGDSVTAFNPSTGATVWTEGVGPDQITTSVPAVSGNLLFLAVECCRLIEMNATTGAVIWNKDVGSGDGIGAATPVVSGDTVYQCADKLFALSVKTGARLWQNDSGVCSNDDAPALANGVLYVSDYSAHTVQALNASTGATEWTASNQQGILSSGPTVANGVVYYPTTAGTVAAYNASTGALLWTSPDLGFGGGGYAEPAVLNGMLYMGGADGLYAFGLGG